MENPKIDDEVAAKRFLACLIPSFNQLSLNVNVETPSRWVGAMRELLDGYDKNPASVIKTFPTPTNFGLQIIAVKDITFFSLCEHHILPFFGTISVGYIPKGEMVGVSKFTRIVNIFAHRLQTQERLVSEIGGAIDRYLCPTAVAVLARARHLCMESRGVKTPGQEMKTSWLSGHFQSDFKARAEVMTLL